MSPAKSVFRSQIVNNFGGDCQPVTVVLDAKTNNVIGINAFKNKDYGKTGDHRETDLGTFFFAKEGNGCAVWVHESVVKNNSNKRVQISQLSQKTLSPFQEAELLFQRAAENKARTKEEALSSFDRDYWFSQLRENSTEQLNNQLSAELDRRGFSSSEKDNSPFFALPAYPAIANAPKGLPRARDGVLQVKKDAIYFPVNNVHGETVGFQISYFNRNETEAKYLWLSGNGDARTKEFGELPLAVYFPSRITNLDIQFVEGVGFKAYLAAERTGSITIGAAGNLFLSSPGDLTETLKVLKRAIFNLFLHKKEPHNYAERKIYEAINNGYLNIENYLQARSNYVIIPDAGFALNSKIYNLVQNLGKFLFAAVNQSVSNNNQETVGDYTFAYESAVLVADYNQITKDSGDIDEIDIDLAHGYPKTPYTIFVQKYKSCGQKKGFADWYTRYTAFTPDIVSEPEKFLSLKPEYFSKDFLLIKKALGGGKTFAVLEWLRNQEIPALLLGYRNNLSKNTVARANKTGVRAIHVSSIEIAKGKKIPSAKLYAGCIDSFNKFEAIANNYEEYIVAIDEICSVIRHIQGGGTLKGRKKAAIEQFFQIVNGAKLVLMLDGNLTDSDVKFLKQVFPDKTFTTVLSPATEEAKRESSRDIYFINSITDEGKVIKDPQKLPVALHDLYKSKKAELGREPNVLFLSDSQTACEVFQVLYEQDSNHFRLDSNTSDTQEANDFLADPAGFITRNGYKSVSISPSGNSGLDISEYEGCENLFDFILLHVCGTLDIKAITQLAARYRNWGIPMFVSCPYSSNLSGDVIASKKSLDEVLTKRAAAYFKTLTISDVGIDQLSLEEMLNGLTTQILNDVWVRADYEENQFQAFERKNLKLCLQAAFTQSGHVVHEIYVTPTQSTEEENKTAKTILKQRESIEVFNASELTDEEAAELNAKGTLKKEEKQQLTKHKLLKNLPGIENTSVWDSEFILQVAVLQKSHDPIRLRRNYHMLLDSYKYNQSLLRANNSKLYFRSLNEKDLMNNTFTKLRILEEFGVAELIKSRIYREHSPEFVRVVENIITQPDQLELLGYEPTGVTLEDYYSDDSEISKPAKCRIFNTFKRLLNLVGCTSTTGRGDRQILPNKQLFGEILADSSTRILPAIDECLETYFRNNREYVIENELDLNKALVQGKIRQEQLDEMKSKQKSKKKK